MGPTGRARLRPLLSIGEPGRTWAPPGGLGYGPCSALGNQGGHGAHREGSATAPAQHWGTRADMGPTGRARLRPLLSIGEPGRTWGPPGGLGYGPCSALGNQGGHGAHREGSATAPAQHWGTRADMGPTGRARLRPLLSIGEPGRTWGPPGGLGYGPCSALGNQGGHGAHREGSATAPAQHWGTRADMGPTGRARLRPLLSIGEPGRTWGPPGGLGYGPCSALGNQGGHGAHREGSAMAPAQHWGTRADMGPTGRARLWPLLSIGEPGRTWGPPGGLGYGPCSALGNQGGLGAHREGSATAPAQHWGTRADMGPTGRARLRPLLSIGEPGRTWGPPGGLGYGPCSALGNQGGHGAHREGSAMAPAQRWGTRADMGPTGRARLWPLLSVGEPGRTWGPPGGLGYGPCSALGNQGGHGAHREGSAMAPAQRWGTRADMGPTGRARLWPLLSIGEPGRTWGPPGGLGYGPCSALGNQGGHGAHREGSATAPAQHWGTRADMGPTGRARLRPLLSIGEPGRTWGPPGGLGYGPCSALGNQGGHGAHREGSAMAPAQRWGTRADIGPTGRARLWPLLSVGEPGRTCEQT
ncbi:collagen alpha-1(I) chain-like [Phocoena phocoena]|uniref:collagen alpha-1(I) chain-like n=1 Tax=Phocoena phocoena TaxID=9742 RepID=UPI003307434C